jgi:signal transduction histidine kinase/DNA-binding response OmpR family regulator
MPARVLIVDDSATQLEALRALLEDAGFTVTACGSGEAALTHVLAHGADLVLSDILMPGMSGYELCRAVKTQLAEPPPVVLLTTLTDPRDIVRGLESGADNYITKPYEPEQLLGRIHDVLENRELRRRETPQGGVVIRFLGDTFRIQSSREQILDLLLSSFEELIRTNDALQQSKRALADAHERELKREQVARGEAEATARRMELLAGASAALSSSFDEVAAIREVADLLVPELADLCLIDLYGGDDDSRRVVAAHEQDTTATFLEQMLLDSAHVPWREWTQGETMTHFDPIPEGFLDSFGSGPKLQSSLRRLAIQSALLLPLTARNRRIGTLVLITTGSRPAFTAAHRSLAAEVAGRVSLAIDNLRLFQLAERDRAAAERAARRIAGLQAVTAALSEALTRDDVISVIIEQGTAVSGAAVGKLLLTSEDGATLTHAGSRGRSSDEAGGATSIALDEALPVTTAVRTRTPVFIGSRAQLRQAYPALAEGRDALQQQAWAAVPLALKGTTIGVLSLGFAEPHSFLEEERAFLVALARQGAQALDRARLFDSEKVARGEAEAATRLRDEVLAIVSHDLRNPLGIIFTGTSLLLDVDLSESQKEQQLRIVKRAAERMNRLISDLLDVSRFESGTVTLETEPIAAHDLLLEIHELFQPLAREKELDFEVVADCSTALIDADRERLIQVFSNLIGNAIKFTPEKGRVRIQATDDDSCVAFAVVDTGPGIADVDLPRIFDRFWQAQQSAQAGAGLGLAIAQAIVMAHGGRIWAESEAGAGSTFRFTLPKAGREAPRGGD